MFNTDFIKYLAKLSKISFDESGAENITKQMHDIIALMDKVKEFKSDVRISSGKSIKYQNVREDTSNNVCGREEAISNVKCLRDGCIVVPKIIC